MKPHSRLMLTVLAGLAEFERELIHARTSEGRKYDGKARKRAQADGVKMSRPPKLDAFQQREAVKRLKAGKSAAAIGRSYKVHRSTIERLERQLQHA